MASITFSIILNLLHDTYKDFIFTGNTALCPTSVRMYAQQDREVIAQNGGSCYAIVPHRVSWTHAEGICNHRGGHLFHVSSSSENTFIYNLLDQMFNHSVWMGLHDIGHEEQFSWISGKFYMHLHTVKTVRRANRI